MRRSKQDLVKSQFIVDMVATQKYRTNRLTDAFDRCWEKVPEGLRKKLNSSELVGYIKTHIVPSVSMPIIETVKEYGIKMKQAHTKEFHA